jgi:translation initiation factor 2B subunit (eIF-2B alpha/beta/delta family)
VIPKLGSFFAILATLSCLVIVISGIAYLHYRSEFIESEREGASFAKHAQETKSSMDFWIKIFRRALIIFSVMIIPSIAIPKRDTIMMIAASEYGETALKSDDVQEIVNPAKQILKKWIEDQLADKEKE